MSNSETSLQGGLLAAAISNMDGVGGKAGMDHLIPLGFHFSYENYKDGNGFSFSKAWPLSSLELCRIGSYRTSPARQA